MKKGWQIFWHVLFWVSIITYFSFVAHDSGKIGIASVLIIFGLFGAINIGLFYLNYLYLLPRFFDRRLYRLYTISVVTSIVIFSLVKYAISMLLRGHVQYHMSKDLAFWSYFVDAALTCVFFLFLSSALKFTVDWFVNERIQRDLETQRLTAELQFLKSQINPHFLFNSLNSIYSLAYQKSDTTPEAILKLSEIMRYMLYESNDNKVDLSKEIQYLQNYIDLQKIRFGDNAYIDLRIDGEITSQRIVPLLLIAFIENAFKHGVANDPEHPIKMVISLNHEQLHFYTENKKHTHNRDASGGIGLLNVKRRLDLLYPGKYTLTVKDEPDVYTCELSLIL